MDFALVIANILVGVVIGAVLGYWLCAHIHSVTAAASSAITRATTVPGHDVATLNSAISGLGDKVAANTAAVGAATNAAIASAAAAAPKAT